MNPEFQNYIVYFIVFLAFYKFTQPVWELCYRLLFKKPAPAFEETSCYTGTCAKCKIKS